MNRCEDRFEIGLKVKVVVMVVTGGDGGDGGDGDGGDGDGSDGDGSDGGDWL